MGRDQKLHGNIAAAISSAAPVVRDLAGRVLEQGDEVILSAPIHTYRVAKIEPIREPGAPPGLMHLRLISVIDLPVPREQPVEGVIRVRTAAEIKPDREEEVPEDPHEKATTVTLE